MHTSLNHALPSLFFLLINTKVILTVTLNTGLLTSSSGLQWKSITIKVFKRKLSPFLILFEILSEKKNEGGNGFKLII